MIIDWRDERWSGIYKYFTLKGEYNVGNFAVRSIATKQEMEERLAAEGIKIIKDAEGRWQGAEFENEEHLAWCILKYGRGNNEAE